MVLAHLRDDFGPQHQAQSIFLAPGNEATMLANQVKEGLDTYSACVQVPLLLTGSFWSHAWINCTVRVPNVPMSKTANPLHISAHCCGEQRATPVRSRQETVLKRLPVVVEHGHLSKKKQLSGGCTRLNSSKDCPASQLETAIDVNDMHRPANG